MSFLSAVSVFHLNKYLVLYGVMDRQPISLQTLYSMYTLLLLLVLLLLLLLITFSSPAPLSENTTMGIEVASSVFLKYPRGSHIDYLRYITPLRSPSHSITADIAFLIATTSKTESVRK